MAMFDFKMRVEEKPGVIMAKLYGARHADGSDYAPIMTDSNKPLLREIARRWNAMAGRPADD